MYFVTKRAKPLTSGSDGLGIAFFFSLLLATLMMMPASPAFGVERAPTKIAGVIKIDAEQLIEMAETNGDLVIIDTRRISDRERGHIDGTVHLANTEMTAERLESIVSRDTPVIFYCNGPNCSRSADSCMKAVQWGWERIYWFRGGMEEWVSKGYPLTK